MSDMPLPPIKYVHGGALNGSENRQAPGVRTSGLPDEPIRIPVRQEELSIGTETVDTGRGVRVEKKVHEEPHAIDEMLRREEVDVRRVAVDRIVDHADAPQARYEGNTLIVPVLEEVLVVEKKLRIKEEIHITKTTRDEHKSEVVSLKSEEISIERFDERRPDESDDA
jgi:uncharacterized protein (TIGR02271 family)